MFYSKRIEDYIEATKGCDAFFLAERDHFKIINYMTMGNDAFPDPNTAPTPEMRRWWGLRRQCRGLIFSHDGNVISLPIMKFFNVNEREETQSSQIDLNRNHVILEKLDGSMCRPIPIFDSYRIGTKMGITDVALMAEEFIAVNPNYDQFIREVLSTNMSPQFEFCSRKQKIVIDYPKDRLVLLSIRDLDTGKEMSLESIRRWANDYSVEVIQEYQGTIENILELLNSASELSNQEGWVIRFLDDGSAVKIKGAEYLKMHRAKDSVLRENAIIELIIDEQLDDIKPLLPESDRLVVEKFENQFWFGVNSTAESWLKKFQEAKQRFGADRKDFAIKMSSDLESALRQSWIQFEPCLEHVIRKRKCNDHVVHADWSTWIGKKHLAVQAKN
jgi:T4 RnlA family RNA ligase